MFPRPAAQFFRWRSSLSKYSISSPGSVVFFGLVWCFFCLIFLFCLLFFCFVLFVLFVLFVFFVFFWFACLFLLFFACFFCFACCFFACFFLFCLFCLFFLVVFLVCLFFFVCFFSGGRKKTKENHGFSVFVCFCGLVVLFAEENDVTFFWCCFLLGGEKDVVVAFWEKRVLPGVSNFLLRRLLDAL